MKTWKVEIPCVRYGNLFDSYQTLTYYVKANSALEAGDKAEEWLPPHYEIDGPFDTCEWNIPPRIESQQPVERPTHGFFPSRIKQGNSTISVDQFNKVFSRQAHSH